MKTEHTIKLFLKFGSEKNIYDLYENGTIYMNPIDRFTKMENDEVRGDVYEAVTEIFNSTDGKIEIPTIGFKGKYRSLHLKGSYEKVLGNIYSLYCISSYGFPNPGEFYIDQRMKKFGSHWLMIKNNPKFLRLIEEKLDSMGFKHRKGFVEYYDKKQINGKVNLFQKPNEFEYQKEFRIYAETSSTEALKFSIGSLKDICEIYKADDISKLTVSKKEDLKV